MKRGVVYFVSAPGRIKVGFTTKPEQRLANLRAQDMEELSVIGTVAATRRLEQKIHGMLSGHVLRGEWFTDCESVREIISAVLSGEIADETALAETAPSAVMSPHSSVDIALAAIDESKNIAKEIERRMRVREPFDDLVSQAVFLATKVIAPVLYPEK